MEVLRWPTQALLKSAPARWEILMLYSIGDRANDLYRSENTSLWVPWSFGRKLWNTGAYLINRAGMERVSDPLGQVWPPHGQPSASSDAFCALQVIDTYLPGAIQDGRVTVVDFTSVAHSEGCHADLVIYLPARTYFCTDLWFVEQGGPSLLNNHEGYISFHSATRDVVHRTMKRRGFKHQTRRLLRLLTSTHVLAGGTGRARAKR